ncbi:Na+/H+ antiporter subunit E [Chakrabartyella piscis]|uniref:Na+/H+ antiporter subunit E n=1 Tax=Chakrabartyella piscis TaxID=2918914 RepID=UPI002958A15D|nr:Na+/H+ antiporter subunit E [Chakrabartyella piscis]
MYIGLLLFWIILHGRITVEIIVLGVLICLGLDWFMCKFLGYSVKKEISWMKKIPLFFLYGGTLTKEIIKSNLAVIKIILSPKMEIEPTLHTFQTNLKTEEARVLLANSITLTPGTYTVHLEDGVYLIHALDPSFADGVEESVFVDLLRKLEG